MIFQFVDEKQSSYIVINDLNLDVGWWKQADTIFSMSFWQYMNGSGLSAFLICHCNPKSKCPKLSMATVLLELRVACEHLPCGCHIWDVSHDCQWDCAAFRGCWMI